MLRKVVLCGMFGLLITARGLWAQEISAGAKAAVARIARVPQFAIGGVGFAGTISQGEKDYQVIVEDAQAARIFADLYEHGNRQAKAYALLGLHRTNPEKFREIYTALSKSTAELLVMGGCIVSTEKLRVVAKQIDEGGF